MKVWALSPQQCIFCRVRACHEELPVCGFCINKLQTLLTDRCHTCGKSPSSCECSENSDVRFLFFYGGYVSRSLMHFIKTNVDDRVVDFFAELLVNSCGIKPSSYDGVTFVPRLRRNIRRYGYDQSKEIAKSISKLYGIPLVETLERVGGGDQKLLSRAERLKSINGRYKLKRFPDKPFKRLLLIDDVCTTGATIKACAGILRGTVAKIVTPLVIAKTNFIRK